MPKQIKQTELLIGSDVTERLEGQMNRIEEEIIASVLLEEVMKSEVAADMVASKIRQRLEVNGYGKLPQPLPDEELREKIEWFEREGKYLPEYRQVKLSEYVLALLPDIEEAEKRGADSGIKAYESTCESLIVEAVKKERERILKLFDDIMERKAFVDLHIVIDHFRQALSGKGGE